MSPSHLAAAGLCVMFAMPAAFAAPVPKTWPKTTAEKLTGAWKLTRSSLGSEDRTTLVVEFARDGSLTIRQSSGDSEPSVYAGTYKVDGDRIPYTVMMRSGEKSETLTIKKLTDYELVVIDPDDVREEFKRERPGGKAGR